MFLKNKISLIIAGILIISYCSGQTDARLPKVIPPAPNAATIQRYGEIPVGPYTGTPNISIPLYEIKSGDITVPITLSYNASGVRVADESGRVGLGWVLNAGGVISRTINGRDDWEDYNLQTFGDIPLGQRTDQGNTYYMWGNCLKTFNGYTFPEVLLNDINVDFKPDLYSYSIAGHSGKFILKRNKDVVLQKIDKIDIKVLGTNADSFQIKTPDGFTYIFQDIESYNDYPVNRKSSWYLSKITSPTGRVVRFIDTAINLNIQQTGSYFESKGISLLTPVLGCDATIPSPYAAQSPEKLYYSLYLSKIIFDQGEVRFNFSSGRTDVVNDVKLDSVRIFQKNFNQPTNTLIKTWSFTYSNFIGTSVNGWTYSGGVDPTKRLKLVSAKESSPQVSLPPYQFFYNNENDPVGNLPSKASFARDHWGYFNGKVGNTSLIPSYTGGGGPTVNIGQMNSERDPDPVKAQIFSLNKIQYPTGGYTIFEYESNDFDWAGSLKNDHSFYGSYVATTPTTLQNSFYNTSVGGTFSCALDMTHIYPYSQIDSIAVSFVKTSGFAPGSGPISLITYSLQDPSGAVISSGQPASWLGMTGYPRTEYLGTSSANSGIKMTLTSSFTKGIYNWSFYVPASYALNAASVVVYYSGLQTAVPIFNGDDSVQGALYGGGLRIKRITDYSNMATPTNVRRYRYHYVGTDGKIYSYGRRMNNPYYSYYSVSVGSNSCNNYYLSRESDSNLPLNGSANGMNIGYDQVEEFFGENGENGKNVYKYWNEPETSLNYTWTTSNGAVPVKPPFGAVIPDLNNGSLIRKISYANINGLFVRKTMDTTIYKELSDINHGMFYGVEKGVVGTQNVPGQNCGMISFIVYPALTVNRPVTVSNTSILYDMSDTTKYISTVTEYNYDSSSHLQLTYENRYRSNGDKVTTKYFYPADFSDAQSDAANLLMKNAAYMHAVPIIKQELLTQGANQYLLNSTISKYQVLNGEPFLKEKAFLENAKPININTPPLTYNPSSGVYPAGYSARLFFDKYDANGNISQVHKSNDANMAYVWDYYGNYPIAEVNNADSTSIAFTSFESNNNGNWSFASTVRDSLNYLTGNRSYVLSNGSISKSGLTIGKIYIISYWSKAGSYSITGGSGGLVTGRAVNSWTYYQHTITTSASTISISGSGNIDELRLYPGDAQMTSYTFSPLIGMTTSDDAGNHISFYQYDNLGRMNTIKDQDGNIIKTVKYHYAGQTPP